jgi:hypothetical protein
MHLLLYNYAKLLPNLERVLGSRFSSINCVSLSLIHPGKRADSGEKSKLHTKLQRVPKLLLLLENANTGRSGTPPNITHTQGT